MKVVPKNDILCLAGPLLALRSCVRIGGDLARSPLQPEPIWLSSGAEREVIGHVTRVWKKIVQIIVAHRQFQCSFRFAMRSRALWHNIMRLTPLLLSFVSLSFAATSSEWAKRTIYQVLTDRFASPTNNTCPFVPPFSLPLNVYCGGTWAALTSRLDYIQGMGFDAIWISPIVDNVQFDYSAGFQGVIQSLVVRAACSSRCTLPRHSFHSVRFVLGITAFG